MHAISKFANIITHGYNICRLKCNENYRRMAYCNGKCIKTKFTYSVVPLFRIPRFTGSHRLYRLVTHRLYRLGYKSIQSMVSLAVWLTRLIYGWIRDRDHVVGI